MTAVDLEPHFLSADPRANLEVVQQDIVADGVPGGGYDLIHTRALIMHLPNRAELIADLARRLRPGGVILLEEADFYALGCSTSELYREVWHQCALVAAKAGGDWYWARHLPAIMVAAGFVDVTAVTTGELQRGGGIWAELAATSWEQLTPMLLTEGYGADRIAAGIAELTDPDRWFPALPIIAASGRRP